MLTWREEGTFIVGDSRDEPYSAVFRVADKRCIGVSYKLTPEEFRQVADKLEEIQGKKEETGKVLWLRKIRRGGKLVQGVYDVDNKQIGYFGFFFGVDRESFTKTTARELSPEEINAIEHFAKQLNFRL